MIEIFLVWLLFGGAPKEVEAHLTQESCQESRETYTAILTEARKARPSEFGQVEVSKCVPVSVSVPAVEKATK